MPFTKVSDPSAADVRIVQDTSLSAYGMLSLESISTDSARNANYSLTAVATIRNAGSTPYGGWQATIQHELGHFFGLHERYRDDGGSGSFCNDESTIMNSGSCSNRSSTPSSLDISRVNAGIYQGGDMQNVTGNEPWFTSKYRLTWQDLTWGETEYRLFFYWWDGAQWIMLNDVSHTAETGMRHVSWTSRTLLHEWDIGAYGKGAGYYVACGNSLHIRGGPGAWRCGDVTWVD